MMTNYTDSGFESACKAVQEEYVLFNKTLEDTLNLIIEHCEISSGLEKHTVTGCDVLIMHTTSELLMDVCGNDYEKHLPLFVSLLESLQLNTGIEPMEYLYQHLDKKSISYIEREKMLSFSKGYSKLGTWWKLQMKLAMLIGKKNNFTDILHSFDNLLAAIIGTISCYYGGSASFIENSKSYRKKFHSVCRTMRKDIMVKVKSEEMSMLLKEDNIMSYEWSEQVRFHPWVGSNFNNLPFKVLLLGDSHYYYDEVESYKCTQDVIQEWCINRKKPGRFLTCIIWTLFGNNGDLEDKYNKVAFYNYVQKLMPAPRISPSKVDYEAAQKPLVEILEKLSPDFVISFGDKMTSYFPCVEECNWKKDNADAGHDVWISAFRIKDRSIPVYALPHPCGNKFNMRTYFQYFLENGITM